MKRARALRFVPILGLAALVAGTLALALDRSSDTTTSTSEPLANKPVSERFSVLSQSSSNQCGLAGRALSRMPDGMRLRGDCCFPMDLDRYRQQLRELSEYRRTDVVPADPYDVSMRLAKRLLSLRGIHLNRAEQRVYERATRMSELGGPCCCPCWRWQAFKGQARFLIARRDYSAARMARLWESEEGCGGSH